MANHKSALKRIRSNDAKAVRNKYQHKTTRTWIKKVRTTESKTEGEVLLKETFSMMDKLAKNNVIHKNKVANLKSSLTKHVNALSA
ncbi:MAG: small subunit ribosomal protein S20 [Bacteroidia bacterium]|jgi:small subunit ribosomal protein S20